MPITPIKVYSDRCESLSKLKTTAVGLPLVFGGAVVSSQVNSVITAASRLRTLPLVGVKVQTQVKTDAVLRIICPQTFSSSTLRSQIKYFVNAGPIAPPQGYLEMQSLESLRNPGKPGPSLSGKRLMREDTVPIFFEIEGEKLATLQASFTAKQKNVVEGVMPLMVIKTGSAIELTAPSINSETGIERLTGSFAISASDTENFPEREIEFGYRFVLSNGMGRNYTIEAGSFTIYSP